jgi:hypothetical protein
LPHNDKQRFRDDVNTLISRTELTAQERIREVQALTDEFADRPEPALLTLLTDYILLGRDERCAERADGAQIIEFPVKTPQADVQQRVA